jgi:hypothetical protein
MTAVIEHGLGERPDQMAARGRSVGSANGTENDSLSRKPHVSKRATTSTTPTDDEILGISGEVTSSHDELRERVRGDGADQRQLEGAGQNGAAGDGRSNLPTVEAALEANPELRAAARSHGTGKGGCFARPSGVPVSGTGNDGSCQQRAERGRERD